MPSSSPRQLPMQVQMQVQMQIQIPAEIFVCTWWSRLYPAAEATQLGRLYNESLAARWERRPTHLSYFLTTTNSTVLSYHYQLHSTYQYQLHSTFLPLPTPQYLLLLQVLYFRTIANRFSMRRGSYPTDYTLHPHTLTFFTTACLSPSLPDQWPTLEWLLGNPSKTT